MLSLCIFFIMSYTVFYNFLKYLVVGELTWCWLSWQIHDWFSAGSLGMPGTQGSAKVSENKWLHDTCVPKQVENLLRYFFTF